MPRGRSKTSCPYHDKVILTRDVVSIPVGEEGYIFNIHYDLLWLHFLICRGHPPCMMLLMIQNEQRGSVGSGGSKTDNTTKTPSTWNQVFEEFLKPEDPTKPVKAWEEILALLTEDLRKVDPAVFAYFVSWLYTGQYPDDEVLGAATISEDLWALGSYLNALIFINLCMDDIIRDYENDEDHYMDAESLEAVYTRSEEDSNLRRLLADIGNCEHPLETTEKGSADWKALNELRKGIRLLREMQLPHETRRWEYSSPWDMQYRKDYLLWYSEDLEGVWEYFIILRQPYDERLKCNLRAKIKIAHLEHQVKGRNEAAEMEEKK